MLIGGCSLAVGVLRGIVTIETAGPLLISSIVSVGAGLLAAYLLLLAQPHETRRPAGLANYVNGFADLATSLAVIASAMPLLKGISLAPRPPATLAIEISGSCLRQRGLQ
jgi:hypothetical protein